MCDELIMVVACKDDMICRLSEYGKKWLESMGSKEIRNLKSKCGFAFIGVYGTKD